MPSTALALDGPLNGQYITPEEAVANGYAPGDWGKVDGADPERVYYHERVPLALYPIANEIVPDAVEAFWDANYGAQ